MHHGALAGGRCLFSAVSGALSHDWLCLFCDLLMSVLMSQKKKPQSNMDNLNKNLSEASVNIECLVLLFIVAADVRVVS